MKQRILVIIAPCLFILALIVNGCQKQVDALPVVGDARMNFYNASMFDRLKGFPVANPPYIFIDEYEPENPQLPAAIRLNRAVYPQSRPGGTTLQNGEVFFMAIPAGQRHLMFADTSRVIQADTTLTMDEGSYTTLYLADSLCHYSLIGTRENPMAQHADEVKVRFVNLSPDSEIGLRMVAEDGTREEANLPQQLAYKAISPYITLDESLALNGSFFLRFHHEDTEEGSFTLRAEPGRAYVVVFEGYREPVTVEPTDQSPEAESVRFERSIHAVVRRMH